MLPAKYIEEIKNHNGLDFHGYVAKVSVLIPL